MWGVFRDALLHTTVVMCSYLHYCHLPLSFDRSGPSPLYSLCPQKCCSLNVFLFFTPFSANSRLLCVKITADQQFLRYSNQPVWHQQSFYSQSLWSHFFLILTFGLKDSWTSWPPLHAFKHLAAHWVHPAGLEATWWTHYTFFIFINLFLILSLFLPIW